MSELPKTKVFISYSHDSSEHSADVLAFSDRLNKNGVDCDIDQYLNGSPEEGWPLWMEQMLNEASYVLVICTETYWNRVQRKEKPGVGKGVKWESLLTYQDIYDNDSLNKKFIPIVFTSTNLEFIPKPLRAGSHYDLGRAETYEKLLRLLSGQPLAIKPMSGQTQHLPPVNASSAAPHIHSDRLPTVKGGFFGREAELQMLNDAWYGEENPHPNPSPRGRGAKETRIIQFIAPGGTGKTKLLRHWLDHTDGIDALIAWSFYSQGASEDKQTSATPFFSHAFEKLGSTRERFVTEEDKGEHLADLLRRQRCVLVLDGLEPLQHAGNGMRGELKDRAIRQLLKNLAGHSNGLCIITTRIAVYELADRAAVVSHDLQNLAPVDGVKLLQSLGVQGKPTELSKTVREYGCHALALTLLGNVLRLRYQGDVQKRDTLKALVKSTGSKESRHAFKVMQAYEDWFADQPELALLHLLGLFDHSIEQAVLQVLWDAQIPHLTAGIDEDDWLEAIAGLREEHHLLSQHDGGGDLDCHPLIREYFGKQLQTQHPDVWQQAHARLYDYYKALPEKELPDTLEEMQPLFSAVAHGCAAGYYQCSLMKIYWSRVQRKEEFYLTKKLGAFSDELETIRHFFAIPWRVPADTLSDFGKAWLLAVAGFSLKAQGRLREALEPTQTALIARIQQKHWKNAAITASAFSELQLSLGDISAALDSASQSIELANKSNCWELQMMNLTTIAHALHQSSRIDEAYQQFRTAEVLQKKYQPNYQYLYGLQGFYYCNLLLSQGKDTEVLLRAMTTQEWVMNAEQDILSAALDELSLGQVYLQQCDWSQAGYCIENAISDLRHYSSIEYPALALLARAALFRHTHDFDKARQDLQEVFEIADYSGMRLHLTDYHLEMARLILAEEEEGVCNTPLQETDVGAYCIRPLSLQSHIAAAARLITETGYHRRDAELAKLQQYIG